MRLVGAVVNLKASLCRAPIIMSDCASAARCPHESQAEAMKMPEPTTTVIYLFTEQNGVFERLDGQEYELSELGGQLPDVGDLIVDPGVLEGQDRRNPENRSVYEVKARYFQPRVSGNVFITMLVEERRGRRGEEEILGA